VVLVNVWACGGWGGEGVIGIFYDASVLSGVKTERFLPHKNSMVFTTEESLEK